MARNIAKRNGKTSSNISETVYSILHKNIVNLNLVPGDRISEMDIAEKLNVSRTPVREAFIRLNHESLVSIFPQKGTFVSKIDLSRVLEERFLREAIECSVVRLFANYHSEASIHFLEDNIRQQEAALDSEQLTDFIELDDRFHAIMYEETKKHLCYNVLESFSNHYRRVRYLSMFISGVSKANIHQHYELFNAIKDHNQETADAIMKQHIQKIFTEKDDICKSYPEYFLQEDTAVDEASVFHRENDFEQRLSDPSHLKLS